MTSHINDTAGSCRIQADRLFPGGGGAPLHDQIIEITAGVIGDIRPSAGYGKGGTSEPIARFDIVAPGFIDLQINPSKHLILTKLLLQIATGQDL